MKEQDRYDPRITAKMLDHDAVWGSHKVKCAACERWFDPADHDGDDSSGEWRCVECLEDHAPARRA